MAMALGAAGEPLNEAASKLDRAAGGISFFWTGGLLQVSGADRFYSKYFFRLR